MLRSPLRFNSFFGCQHSKTPTITNVFEVLSCLLVYTHTHTDTHTHTHTDTINPSDMVVFVEYLISPVSTHTASTAVFAFVAYRISSASSHTTRCLRGIRLYFICKHTGTHTRTHTQTHTHTQSHSHAPEAMAVFEIHLQTLLGKRQKVFL